MTTDDIALESDRGRILARIVLTLGAGWIILIALLWITTRAAQPTINIRWKVTASEGERSRAAKELSLVPHASLEPGTVSYFVLDADSAAIRRIVLNPLVEDTAFINRGSFVLEHAPTAEMWMGDRAPLLKRPVFFYLSFIAALASGVVLLDKKT